MSSKVSDKQEERLTRRSSIKVPDQQLTRDCPPSKRVALGLTSKTLHLPNRLLYILLVFSSIYSQNFFRSVEKVYFERQTSELLFVCLTYFSLIMMIFHFPFFLCILRHVSYASFPRQASDCTSKLNISLSNKPACCQPRGLRNNRFVIIPPRSSVPSPQAS